MSSQEPQKAGALPNPYSLPNPYAKPGLPNPYAAATVAASAPVKFTEEQAKAEQKKKAPAFHNPHKINRPQPKNAAQIKKPTMPKVSSSATTSSDPDAASATKTERHDINYYRSSADDDAAVLEELRQRQREEAQRKKELKKFHKQFGYWNPYAPYKADRPTNLEAYRASGGYRRKQEGFNDFLRSMRRDNGEVSINSKPVSSSSSTSTPPSFATKPSFAPPASYDPPTMSREQADEDPYLHRMRLSGQQSVAAPPPPPTPQTRSFPPPPTGSDDAPPPPPPPPPQALNADAPGTPAASSSVYHSATISAPPVRYANATISAPPVRYEQPPARPSKDESNISERPAKRVKTMTTAEKIMLKMGHKEGQGLGKNNDGITTALEVKKRKSAPGGQSGILDDGAGQKVRSAQVWDVSGGQRKKDEPGKFGEESPVVVTWGCVEGVDWKENAERNDGGIRQEMGEAFSTKFGPVERLHVDESNPEGVVYIYFQSILSALNAVNRFDEGFQFRGRNIRAKYYDERKFHSGVYDG